MTWPNKLKAPSPMYDPSGPVASVSQFKNRGSRLNHPFFARFALSVLCAVQGISTVVIDFNRTHATNPSWPGHARFHVVWQSIAVFLLSAVELLLLWIPTPFATQCFYLASLLAAISPLGFLAAFASRKVYGGTLSDPNGIPPVHLKLFGTVRAIDLNLAAVLAALVSLLAFIAIFRS
jgi:hypothetical protein